MAKNAVLVDTTKLSIKQMEVKLTNLVKKSIKKREYISLIIEFKTVQVFL